MTTAVILNKNGNPEKFPANDRTVKDMIEALKSRCLLDNVTSGTWIGSNEMPLTLPSIKNTLQLFRSSYPHVSSSFPMRCQNSLLQRESNTSGRVRIQRSSCESNTSVRDTAKLDYITDGDTVWYCETCHPAIKNK